MGNKINKNTSEALLKIVLTKVTVPEGGAAFST
jgi:hypothetical protein